MAINSHSTNSSNNQVLTTYMCQGSEMSAKPIACTRSKEITQVVRRSNCLT